MSTYSFSANRFDQLGRRTPDPGEYQVGADERPITVIVSRVWAVRSDPAGRSSGWRRADSLSPLDLLGLTGFCFVPSPTEARQRELRSAVKKSSLPRSPLVGSPP